jgi:hypothetical protein
VFLKRMAHGNQHIDGFGGVSLSHYRRIHAAGPNKKGRGPNGCGRFLSLEAHGETTKRELTHFRK